MILILGSKGMLGGALRKVFPSAIFWDRDEVDVTKISDLRFKIEHVPETPEAIINCVAFNDVDGAEEKKDAAFLLNGTVPGNLASLCKGFSIPLIHFSTNFVFDGAVGEYKETDTPHPVSVYGQSKYEGETKVVEHTDKYYIIRTAVLFGEKGESELSKKSFVELMLDLSQKSDTIKAVEDEINSVTYVKDLAATVKEILDQNLPYGTYHVTNSGSASWYDLAKEIFTIAKKNITLIPVPALEFPRKALRPKKSVLLNTKLPALRSWQSALAEFLNLKS